MDGYDYDAAASTVKIEDITNDEFNREILRRLKDNDPDFVEMWVRSSRVDENDYRPEGPRDFGWLGYYIGKNMHLKELFFQEGFNKAIEPFYRGVSSNRSIQRISFHVTDLSGGEVFQSLGPFFESNSNLYSLAVVRCQFGAGCARQLSLALRGCNNSLKYVRITNSQMGEEPLTDIIEALSVHPQLESLEFPRMSIGRSECISLAALLHHTSEIHTLDLCNNDIDDEGVDILVGAITNSGLSVLDLSFNRNITARGCQSLAALLENPNTNLDMLDLGYNNVGDEGALVFANALTRNSKLKTLDLQNNGIAAEGLSSSFSKVLCDTSSVNNTFLSNHTLESLGYMPSNLPADIRASLALNESSDDKNQVATRKILQHHQHFDMQPFFEWDLKVLPIAVKWFERAQSIENNEDIGVGRHKLGAIYQFIRAMPEVFEPVPAAGGLQLSQLMIR